MKSKVWYFTLLFSFVLIMSFITVYALVVSDTYDVSKDFNYPSDGLYGNPGGGHYYIYRANSSEDGHIDFQYRANTNLVYANISNIRKIEIDMYSLYENHSYEVWVEDLSFEEIADFWVQNRYYILEFNGSELDEVVLYDLDSEPTSVLLNGTSIPFDYSGGTFTLNLTEYNLTGQNTIEVYFRDNITDFQLVAINLFNIFIVIILVYVVSKMVWTALFNHREVA